MKQDSKNLSIIDRDLIVDGKISSKGSLVIRGKVTGSLTGENIIIAEEGHVSAETEVASLTVGGTFEGQVRASKELIIQSTGNFKGTVHCGSLTVESGGLLNAEVIFISSDTNDMKKDKQANTVITS